MAPLGAFVSYLHTCHTLSCVCTHACVCPPVCPCVRCVGRATSITLWLFIKTLLPGNLVAWQHEWGSPRGDFNQAQRERKQKEKGRAGHTSSTSSFPPFGVLLHGSTVLHNFLKISQLLSQALFWQHTENSLRIYSETHMNTKPGRWGVIFFLGLLFNIPPPIIKTDSIGTI